MDTSIKSRAFKRISFSFSSCFCECRLQLLSILEGSIEYFFSEEQADEIVDRIEEIAEDIGKFGKTNPWPFRNSDYHKHLPLFLITNTDRNRAHPEIIKSPAKGAFLVSKRPMEK